MKNISGQNNPAWRPLKERFEEKYIPWPDGGCWIWVGCIDGDGYGRILNKGAARKAHRISYELFIGPIPENLTIDHLCTNPSCVNPDHLEAVGMKENILRGRGPAAVNARKNRCSEGHLLSPDNLVPSDLPKRRCAICNRVNRRVYMRQYRQRFFEVALILILILSSGCMGAAKLFSEVKTDPAIIGMTGFWLTLGIQTIPIAGGIPVPGVTIGRGTVFRVGAAENISITTGENMSNDEGADGVINALRTEGSLTIKTKDNSKAYEAMGHLYSQEVCDKPKEANNVAP